MASKVEIILIKYNAPAFERKAIKAVLACTEYPNYSLNAHQNERGIGLATCWNRLIAASNAKYICLLNTDTVVTPGWLDKMVAVLDTYADVVAVVPSSNLVHMSQIDTPLLRDEMDEVCINEFAGCLPDRGLITLETCSAMCVLFRKSAWEGERFDEAFYLYGEDTEFFYRLVKRGLGRIQWHTGVYVHHYGQQSMAQAVADGEFIYAELRQRAATLWEDRKAAIDCLTLSNAHSVHG